MRDKSKERSELLSAIQDLGYESLRFSIFNEHRPLEWETRIEFNNETEKYEVYLTRDRAGKERFLSILILKKQKKNLWSY